MNLFFGVLKEGTNFFLGNFLLFLVFGILKFTQKKIPDFGQ